MFADNIRGFVTTIVDMKERPEQLEEAWKLWKGSALEDNQRSQGVMPSMY